MKKLAALLLVVSFALSACSPSASQLKKTLEDNPDIITNLFEKHPDVMMEALNKAVREAQKKQFENREKKQAESREDEFNNPKKPNVAGDRAAWGPQNAPITIVEYSDFECPFCKKGYNTVKEVKKKYGDKVRVIYKHLPLDFHPLAMPAAQYFEAIALQSPDKAYEFHDLLFDNQDQLKSKKEKYFEEAAKKVGADIARVKKDLDSEKVKKRIEEDMAEARKFGFTGTPGFLINGVSIKGAYPADEFAKIIDRHLKN